MKNSLNIFSNFVSQMHDRLREDDAEDLARWAVIELSNKLGFDAAWYGWANICPSGVEIHANASLGLPDAFYDTWQTMSDQDLLAAKFMENPGQVATYNTTDKRQTEGMIHLTGTYGLKRIATVMHMRPGRVASFYLSSYRVGQHARDWSEAERQFLQCAVDQLSSAMKLSASETIKKQEGDAISIFVNEDGVGILGVGNLRAQLGELWPEWDGDQLPQRLRSIMSVPGEHIFADRQLVVRSEEAPRSNGMALRKLTLRKFTPLDLLTHRERKVAQTLALGKSHKEAARILGVAPATIRNQTQAVYAKLGVDNRASLVALLHEKSLPHKP